MACRLAAQARLSEAEADLRLVEYALGPLGRIRSASGAAAHDPRDPQPSVLRLAEARRRSRQATILTGREGDTATATVARPKLRRLLGGS